MGNSPSSCSSSGSAPGALPLIEELEAELPSGDEVQLDLPISIYGGG